MKAPVGVARRLESAVRSPDRVAPARTRGPSRLPSAAPSLVDDATLESGDAIELDRGLGLLGASSSRRAGRVAVGRHEGVDLAAQVVQREPALAVASRAREEEGSVPAQHGEHEGLGVCDAVSRHRVDHEPALLRLAAQHELERPFEGNGICILAQETDAGFHDDHGDRDPRRGARSESLPSSPSPPAAGCPAAR